MAMQLITIKEISSESSTPTVTLEYSSSVANSYPRDLSRALAAAETMTGTIEQKRAFQIAGLR